MKRKLTVYLSIAIAALIVSAGPAFAGKKNGGEPDMETIESFLGLMESYLDVSEQWIKMVEDEDTAVYLVAERITEIYEGLGSKEDAIPELRDIAKQYEDNRAVRNVVHFKIGEIYKEAGKHEEALEELHSILEAEKK